MSQKMGYCFDSINSENNPMYDVGVDAVNILINVLINLKIFI